MIHIYIFAEHKSKNAMNDELNGCLIILFCICLIAAVFIGAFLDNLGVGFFFSIVIFLVILICIAIYKLMEKLL